MNERRSARDLADAVLSGQDVDWERAARDPHLGAVLQPLKSLEATGRERIDSNAPSLSPRRSLLDAAVLVVTIAHVGVALFGYAAGVDVQTPVPAGAALLTVLAFSLAAAWLYIGGRWDPRARTLAVLYLLIASSFARRFTGVSTGTWIEPVVRGVYPEAFLPALAWAFVRDFPRLVRFSRWDGWTRLGMRMSVLVGTVLFVANVAIVRVPGVVPAVLARGHRPGVYWGALLALSAVALVVGLLRAREAMGDEQTRARLFGVALAAPLLPVAIEILAEVVVPGFRRVMVEPAMRRAVAPVLFTLLLSVPFLTAYAVIVRRVLDVRVVVARALQLPFARTTLIVAIGLPLVGLAFIGYRHRDLPLAALLSGFTGGTLAVLTVLAAVGLALHRRVLDVVEGRLLGPPVDVGASVGALTSALRGSRSVLELVERFEAHVDRTLGTASMSTFLRDVPTEPFKSCRGEHRTFPSGSALSSLVEADAAPVATGLDEAGTVYSLLSANDRHWVDATRSTWLVPMVGAPDIVLGVVAVGPKCSGAPFRRVDRQYLEAATSALALAVQSMRSRDDGPSSPIDDAASECAVCGVVSPMPSGPCPCGGVRQVAPVPAVVSGKFQVERRLGTGGMGLVYLGMDMDLRRPVALKTLSRLSQRSIARLSDEARLMASLAHPHLATIHGLEWWHGTPILVVEYCAGGTLAARLAAGPLPVATVLNMGIALARGLEHLHRAGLLHRDVKPANIGFAGLDALPKLLDFGLATMSGPNADDEPPEAAPESRARDVALTGLAGTALYMPPEAFAGTHPNPGWDVWALSISLFEAMAGAHPFRAASVDAVIRRVTRDPVPSLRDLRSDCPDNVADAFTTMLSEEPSRRPASAVALRQRLEELAANHVG